jgi:hypothetical protein
MVRTMDTMLTHDRLRTLLKKCGLSPVEVFVGGGMISVSFATEAETRQFTAKCLDYGVHFQVEQMTWLESEPWQALLLVA